MARRGSRDFDPFEEADLVNPAEAIFQRDIQANPLAYGRPSIYEQYREPVETPALEGISPEVAAANPLLTPPRPIKYMPIEEQIAWSERQAEALGKQALLQERLNLNTRAAREAELEIQRRAQSTKIIDALGDLDPTSEDYLDKKSRLFGSNPVGATSDEVKTLFGVKDQAWQLREEQRKGERDRRAVTEEALRKESISQAKKDAVDIGDSAFMEEISKDFAQDPDVALRKVAKKKNDVVGQNLNTQLAYYGVPDDEIKRLYHDPITNLYRVDAAAARLKIEEARRAAGEKVVSEAQAADIFSTLSKQKAEAASPMGAAEGKTWTPQQEQMLQVYQSRLSAFTQAPARTQTPVTRTPAPSQAPIHTVTGPNGQKMTWSYQTGKWEPMP